MTDRPILFSGAMVRAILDGRKTQTRRVIKPQPSDYKVETVAPQRREGLPPKHPAPYFDAYNGGPHWCWWDEYDRQGADWIKCPYGVPGDRLWVREAWTATFWTPEDIDGPPREFWATPRAERTEDLCSDRYYRASEEIKEPYLRFAPEGQWTPSIHMPRWASRITLGITGVRVERLNDCSPEDAKAEGLEWVAPTYGIGGIASTWNADPVAAYRALWEHINGPGSWAANPWVWVVEFPRAEAAHG